MSIRIRYSVGKAVDTAFCCRFSLSVTNSASRSCPDISFHNAKSLMIASYPSTADRSSDAEDERHTRLIVLDPQMIQEATEVQSCSSNKRFDHLDSCRRPNCRGNRHGNIVGLSKPRLYLGMTRFVWAYWRAAFARFASRMVGVTN
jgi:hypothetical protein